MTGRAVLLHAAAAAALLVPGPARAQTSFGRESEYEVRHGAPIDVSITDLEQNPDAYLDKAVRTHGSLDLDGGQRNQYMLRDSLGATVKVVPVEEVREQFQRQEHAMLMQDVEVTGVVKWTSGGGGQASRPGRARVQILFWSFNADPRQGQDEKKAVEVSLESLVLAPGRRDGQLVRVVGQFRGGNLFGDLPMTSRRAGGDWVIRNEGFAVWITGKRPKGDGFELDRSSKADAGRWVEVVGRPVSRRGITWIQAVRVAMATAPPPVVQAQPAAPQRPPAPPVVVFAMPVDGDAEVAADSRFTVQFSKDMDESSFRQRVVLRYAGPTPREHQPIPNMTFTYDGGRRTLIVDPGLSLAAHRRLELLLLPGIVDSEGVPLAPRAGSPPALADGVVEVLRYSTGS
jgi:hypothetical protein